MGCDTRAKLRGHIEPEQLLAVIRELFDPKATMDKPTKTVYKPLADIDWTYEKFNDDDKVWYSVVTRINFTYNGEQRSLFYMYDNINTFEGEDYYVDKNPALYEMVHSETTHVSFRAWGSSVEILRKIASVFGGWVDDNDCDEETYYYVEKNTDPNNIIVKPVREVTMEDVYKAFGEIVRIVDRR